MARIIRKMREVGIKNSIFGGGKILKYEYLRKKYHFDKWHTRPYELRKYLQEVTAYINKQNADVVVDIGCGLGELLRHVNARVKVGFDMNEEPIEAARMLSRDDIVYHVGSFDMVKVEEPIDYLVTLGFTHGSREETWASCYHDVARRNEIRHFIVDTVPEGWDGAYHLDYSIILPDDYRLIDQMGPLLGGRVIEVYEKY